MVQAVSGEIVRQSRELEQTRATKRTQWRTQFIGPRTAETGDEPQAFLAEMASNGVVVPHFHTVNQFQVLIAGSGSLGRNALPMIALHYADHHTAYGPINAGPYGLSFFTIRAQGDSGPVYLHNPGYKEHLRPSKQRYLLAENIAISTEPVLQHRKETSLESLLEGADFSDGLSAYVLRLGAGMATQGPDPALSSGQYYVIVNGTLQLAGASYPRLSLVYVGPSDKPLAVQAGDEGLESLILNFPRLAA